MLNKSKQFPNCWSIYTCQKKCLSKVSQRHKPTDINNRETSKQSIRYNKKTPVSVHYILLLHQLYLLFHHTIWPCVYIACFSKWCRLVNNKEIRLNITYLKSKEQSLLCTMCYYCFCQYLQQAVHSLAFFVFSNNFKNKNEYFKNFYFLSIFRTPALNMYHLKYAINTLCFHHCVITIYILQLVSISI